MLNTTHTLVGLALARTPLGRRVPKAAWVAAIAANFPDVDIVARLAGGAAYLDYHRGITHALVGVVVGSLLLPSMILVLGRWWTRRSAGHAAEWQYRPVAALTGVALASHPLLDFTNSYGLRPLLPFDSSWIHGDLVFIVSLYLDAALLVAVAASYIFKRRAEALAGLGLAALIAFWGLSLELHQRAIRSLQDLSLESDPVLGLAALPSPLNLLEWTGVAEKDETYERYKVSLRYRSSRSRFEEAAPKPTLELIRWLQEKDYAMRVFLDFARFPVCEKEELPVGKRFLCYDFGTLRREQNAAFGAEALFDSQDRVVRSDFSFSLRLRDRR